MTKFRRSENCKNCKECNEKSPLFKSLNDSDLEIANENRFEVKFKTGENIIKQGMPAAHFITLTSGLAKIFIEGVNQKSLILDIITPYHQFGGPGLFLDKRYHYSVTAIEDSTACFTDVNNIKALVRRNPDFAESFIELYSLDNSKTYERFISLTQKQMHGRIADALLYLVYEVYKNTDFNVTISKQDIADLTAMTRDSAIRILKEFHNEKIIQLNGKKMHILDMSALENISLHG